MRDSQRLAKIRQLPCCQCGASSPSQACHSNWGEHGKGRGLKADDYYTIPLCHTCHRWLDQFQDLDREESKNWFIDKLEFINRVLDEKPNEPIF